MAIDPSLPEWDGPAELACSFSSEHTNAVRYKWNRYPGLKGFYVPRALLRSVAEDSLPKKIIVVLGKSPSRQTLGFKPEKIAPRTLENFWEFDLSSKTCGKVVRYDVWFGGQNYPLYVPKEVFGGLVHPDRVFVQLRVSDEP